MRLEHVTVYQTAAYRNMIREDRTRISVELSENGVMQYRVYYISLTLIRGVGKPTPPRCMLAWSCMVSFNSPVNAEVFNAWKQSNIPRNHGDR